MAAILAIFIAVPFVWDSLESANGPDWFFSQPEFASTHVPVSGMRATGTLAAKRWAAKDFSGDVRVQTKNVIWRPMTKQHGIAAGTRIDYRLSLFGLPFNWRSLISHWEPPHTFVDEQVQGLYALWHHTHTFSETDEGTLINDRVLYRLPLWPLGEIALPVVKLQLKRIFGYRQQAIRSLLLS